MKPSTAEHVRFEAPWLTIKRMREIKVAVRVTIDELAHLGPVNGHFEWVFPPSAALSSANEKIAFIGV